MLDILPEETLAWFTAASGKSRDTFIGDADNLIGLIVVPIMSIAYALAFAPLLRVWDPDDLGWRRGFRASFVYLNASTIPVIPFTWMAYAKDTALVSSLLISLIMFATFMRMGAGRWYRSPIFGVLKGLTLITIMQFVGFLGYLLVIPIGLFGAVVIP